MINVIYAGNSAMFDGVFLSTTSLARRTKEEVKCWFMTMDFTEINPAFTAMSKRQEAVINEVLQGINPSVSFQILDCTDEYIKMLENNPNEGSAYSPYTLLRLLIPNYSFFQGKVIYLDCDTMVYGDIKELYDIDINDKELAVCHDYLGRFWLKKTYFNAGVLLINMEKIRETKLFERGIKMLNSKKMYFSDQEVLNRLVTSYIYFPDEYRFNEQRSVKPNTVIKHFCKGISWVPFFRVYNIKQWDVKNVHRILKIHEFDEDFNYYLDVKKKIDERKKEREERKNRKYIVQISHLVKSYGNLRAVNDVSFNVRRGALFAFLGINGAGKSTTINIISSILSKDYGKVIIDGFNLDEQKTFIKREIGIVFQTSVLDDVLTVEENLKSRAAFYGMTKKERQAQIKSLTKILHLGPILNQPVKKLSGGQRRRVDIARSMLHEPKLLILDEPTTGLDPKTRIDVWRLIDRIREEKQMTVFLTTHYLEEADKATDVVIMDHGEIIAQGTPTQLKNLYSNNYVVVYSERKSALDEAFYSRKYEYNDDTKAYLIVVSDSDDAKEFINSHDDLIKDFEVRKGNMDDVFLNVTGKRIVAEEEDKK